MNRAERSDAELVARARRGDEAALEALYDRHAPHALGLALRILVRREAAEDIVQEAFFRVWERADLFDAARGEFSAWLTGIVRNLCLDHLRRTRARPPIADSGPDREGEAFSGVPDPAGDVPEAVAARDRRRRVRAAIAGLPEEQRRIVELSYFGGMTRREIAAFLRCPEGTVHTRARLALQKLRAALADEDTG